MTTQEQRIAALSDFLESSAFARVDGHDLNDGVDCKSHAEAFTAKAKELLELIEGNYGYEPELISARSIQPTQIDGQDYNMFIARLDWEQLGQFNGGLANDDDWFTLKEFRDGSTDLVRVSAEDFPAHRNALSKELPSFSLGSHGLRQWR